MEPARLLVLLPLAYIIWWFYALITCIIPMASSPIGGILQTSWLIIIGVILFFSLGIIVLIIAFIAFFVILLTD